MRSNSGGTARVFRDGGAGLQVRIAASTSEGVAPVKCAVPVSISCSTTPMLKMSVCPSTCRRALAPETCTCRESFPDGWTLPKPG